MLISIRNLIYGYKKHIDVLNDINLDIKENQLNAILGHNGAGKTTLFKLIAGYLKVKTGSIVFNSDFINNKKQLAFVPETGGFFGTLTVWENLRFRYLISDQPIDGLYSRIDILLKAFGLYDHRDKKAKNLSSGLKKRLSISCAMVHRPKVLLLDEPTNGIDPTTHEILIKILKSLKQKGTNILLNSHDLDFVARVADNVTILDHGKIVYEACISNMSRESLEETYFKYTESFGEDLYESI